MSGAGPRSADDGVTHGESLQTPSLLTPGPGARGGAETIIMRTQNVEQEREQRGDWDKSCDSDIEATCPAHCLSLID